MHFTQQIIAILALLSICAYAKPASAGSLVVHGASWCGPYDDAGECDEHCQLAGFGKGTCNPKYVNLNKDYIRLLTSIDVYSNCFCVSFLSYHDSYITVVTILMYIC